MKTFWQILLLILLLTSFFAITVQADVPDLEHSIVNWAYEGNETITLLNIPDGSGAAFAEARDGSGNIVDATITLYVLDYNDSPLVGYPREDMWLESSDQGMVLCTGGSNPQQDTDEDGMTYWSAPLLAGGYSQDICEILVNGEVLGGRGVPLQFNSPDINGDRVVDLADVAYFVQDFLGDYNFRSDLFPDGVINLADLSLLARGLGTECP